jgi:hypothetical protein
VDKPLNRLEKDTIGVSWTAPAFSTVAFCLFTPESGQDFSVHGVCAKAPDNYTMSQYHLGTVLTACQFGHLFVCARQSNKTLFTPVSSSTPPGPGFVCRPISPPVVVTTNPLMGKTPFTPDCSLPLQQDRGLYVYPHTIKVKCIAWLKQLNPRRRLSKRELIKEGTTARPCFKTNA